MIPYVFPDPDDDCDCHEHPDYRSGEDWHVDGCDSRQPEPVEVIPARTEWVWHCEPAGTIEPLTEHMTRCDTYGEPKGTDRHAECGEIQIHHPEQTRWSDGRTTAAIRITEDDTG